MLKLFRFFFKPAESCDQMRERINRQNREYNASGIASIKFFKGEWYE